MARRLDIGVNDFIGNEEVKEQPKQERQQAPQPMPVPTPVAVAPQIEVVTEKRRPGRPPAEKETVRDFLSVNLCGRRQKLKRLCIDEELRTGESVSLNAYILRLIDADIESKKDILARYGL